MALADVVGGSNEHSRKQEIEKMASPLRSALLGVALALAA
jgi:hypothetical protein